MSENSNEEIKDAEIVEPTAQDNADTGDSVDSSEASEAGAEGTESGSEDPTPAATKVVKLKEDWTDTKGELRTAGTEIEVAADTADQLVAHGQADFVEASA